MKFPEIYLQELISNLVVNEKEFYGQCLRGQTLPGNGSPKEELIMSLRKEIEDILKQLAIERNLTFVAER